MKLTNQTFNINTSEDDYSNIINNQNFLYQTSIEDYNTYLHTTTISKPNFTVNTGLFYTIDTKVYDENGSEISSKHTNEDFRIKDGIYYYGNGSIFDISLNKGAYTLYLGSSLFKTQFNGGEFLLMQNQIDYKFGSGNINNRFWMQDSILQLWSKVNGNDDYAVQIMSGNTWFKSDTENWEFGINSSAPHFYAYANKGTNNAKSLCFDVHSSTFEAWSKPAGYTKEQYKLYLSPGGTVINTYNSGNETIFNQSPSGIILQSIIPNVPINALIEVTSGSIQAQAKNPGTSADLFINSGIGGLKYQNPANLHQLTFGDTTTSDIFTDLSVGLQYINYFDGNNNVYATTDKFVKLNAMQGNFAYEYKSNNTNTKLNITPNNCYILSSDIYHLDKTDSFNLQLHYGNFNYTNVYNSFTGSNDNWTLQGTYTTSLILNNRAEYLFNFTTETTNYVSDSYGVADVALQLKQSVIHIHTGNGITIPKSVINFNPASAVIEGIYNNLKYDLEWKWLNGNGTDGLYGSIVNATTNVESHKPVLKGFKIYDENNKLISNSYLPLTGGTLTGNLYIDTGTIDTFDNLKKKSTFNPGMIYLEMRDSTDSNEMAKINLDPRNSITWSRKKLSNNQPKTTTYINDEGYYLTTYDDNDTFDAIYIQAGQLELVNNRITDTSHPRGQINLSTNGLEVQKKDTATGQLIGNVKIDCFGLPQVYLYSCPVDGDNTTVRGLTLNQNGLNFLPTNKIQNLYISENGIGYSTKKSYGKKVTSYLTQEAFRIEYEKTPEENIIETDTILFKPDTDDNNKIKFVLSHNVSTTIDNTVENTKHSVTVYNGHTSTTQTNFDDNDYITKSYANTLITPVDLSNYIPNEGNTKDIALRIERTNGINLISDAKLVLTGAINGKLTTIHTDSAFNYLVVQLDEALYEVFGYHMTPEAWINEAWWSYYNDFNFDERPYISILVYQNGNEKRLYFVPCSNDYMDSPLTIIDDNYHDTSTYASCFYWYYPDGANNVNRGRVSDIPVSATIYSQFEYGLEGISVDRLTWDNNNVVLRADTEGKAYYIKGDNLTNVTNDDEIATIKDMDSYLAKSGGQVTGYITTTKTTFDDDQQLITKKYSDDQYEDLLERYIALEARVRALEPPVVSNYLKTKLLDTISFNIGSQNADDDYTIDWGDGNTSQSGDGTNISHNYSTTDSYTITFTPNNNSATGTLSNLKNKIVEIDIDAIGMADIYDDDTIEKVIVDNNIMFPGSWGYPFVEDATVIAEVHIKENCVVNWAFAVFKDCPVLTKVVMDAPITNHDNNFFENCPNLTEVHLTSTTMPTFAYGSLFDTIPTGLIIYVPSALLNDYQTALPDYASYMVGE